MYNRNMYARIYKELKSNSYFVFGPRNTGKSTWVRQMHPDVFIVDLLHSETFRYLLNQPSRLAGLIPENQKLVVIDEVQKIPELLDEVHRLIEAKKIHFILTGSSARKLKRQGVNLLAGRARQRFFHPLTCWELGKDFDLHKALKFGLLPTAYLEPEPKDFLSSYINTYLKEEILAEGLVRNIATYSHFLEVASFSQAMPVTMTSIASDVGVDSKLIANYFDMTEDMLLSFRVPVFSKKAKRRMTTHPKFYFFDVGVFRALRPKGPLDIDQEIDGPALETLFFQHYRALGEGVQWDQKPFFWKTASKNEVDFVSYGEEGLFAFEIKRSNSTRQDDLNGLRTFKKDFPIAKCFLLNFSKEEKMIDGIQVMNFEKALWQMPEIFGFKLSVHLI